MTWSCHLHWTVGGRPRGSPQILVTLEREDAPQIYPFMCFFLLFWGTQGYLRNDVLSLMFYPEQ